MFRLLVAGAILYVAYRIATEITGDWPPSQDEREMLRRQSAALGVDPLH